MSPEAPPRVSVLLPARNAGATVERAARSILAGTLRPLELLAVDDGSTDGTGRVLARLAEEDARVRVLDGGGRGLVAALHQALAVARAPLVARMDADDESLPGRLAAQVAALDAEPALAGVGSAVEVFREDRPPSPSLRTYAAWLGSLTTPERLYRERFIESPLCHPAVCLRAEAVRAVGGWQEGDFPEDYALWLALLDAGHRLRALPEVLLRWRDGEGRMTRTDPRYERRRHTRLKARFLARAPELAGRRVTVMGTGPEGLALSRFLREEGVDVWRLADVHPRKVGTRIHGLPVVHRDAVGGPGGEHKVLAVGTHGVREELRAQLAAAGCVEGRDFTCAA
jgi:glycosyltransferase involved in cell wall biosynthesis